MIGGTGLLGSMGAKELINRGHEVKSIALPPLPEGADLPKEMKLEFGNYLELSDQQLKNYMQGCEGFVFAAGIDERVEGKPPVYEMFKKYNNDPLERLLRLAKECGVKHAVILGSYFSYFAKKWPKLELAKYHPYIRSRIDQEKIALSFADDNFDVAVLELPYIFGTQPGRKPVWVFLVEMIAKMKKSTMWPKGGTTMVTTRQVGQAIAGAMEKNKGGNCYPIGWYNLSWKEFLTIVHKYMGCEGKKVVTIPTWMFKLGCVAIRNKQKKNGIEGGLNMVKFARVQASQTYIEKEEGCLPLGVEDDDIEKAIGQSVVLCKQILDGKAQNIVEMKGE